MTVEPMALSVLASSALGTVGFMGWRRYRSSCQASGLSPFQVVETYIHGQADATRERERRATIVATVAAMPPGATLVDRRADGATLTIRMPVMPAASQEPASMEPRRGPR